MLLAAGSQSAVGRTRRGEPLNRLRLRAWAWVWVLHSCFV